MAQETRKGKRAPAALRVRFRAGTVEEFIDQQSPNISSGGMFIKSKSPLARGTLMVFDFQLQDGSPLIKGVGRVVWARKPESAGTEPPGMGIKFIRVEPESLPTFQKIMAGKRPSEEPKDVIVRLGETGKGEAPDGRRAPTAPPTKPATPAAASSKPAAATASSKPAATASSKPAATASSKPAAAASSKPAAATASSKPAAAASSSKPAAASTNPAASPMPAESPQPTPGKPVPPWQPSASSKPEEPFDPQDVQEPTMPMEADLRATPRFDELPTDLIKDVKARSQGAASIDAALLDDEDETPVPTGIEAEEAAGDSAPPADTDTDTAPAGELSRPIKVLQTEGEQLSPPSVPREGVQKPVDTSTEKTKMGTPISEMLDSSQPAAQVSPQPPAADGSADARRPVSKQTAPEEKKKSSAGLIVAIIVVLILVGGGVALYVFMPELFGIGGGGSAERPTPQELTPQEPTPPAQADAAQEPETLPDAAAVTAIDAGANPGEAGAPQVVGSAPAQEEAPRRTLVITSDPDRSPVTFNTRPVGRTPQTITSEDINLSRTITIVVSRRGHRNFSETIEQNDPRWVTSGNEQRLELHAELARHARDPSNDGERRRRREQEQQNQQQDSGQGSGGGDNEEPPTPPTPPENSGAQETPDSTEPASAPTTPPPPEPGDVSDNPY